MNTVKQEINLLPNTQINYSKNNINIYRETKTLTRRLYIQTYRRPAILIINIIQPLVWLILFGALFQKTSIYLFNNYNIQYREFLNPGIIVFIGFNSSINAGLPIMFDREFGFLNRILSSPLINKKSLIYSAIVHIWSITSIQIILLIAFNTLYIHKITEIKQILIILAVNTLIIINISSISICNAFTLPGHIEFIALTTLFVNIPTLFSSTALAPLSFMPYWLQIIVCLNPLTYAIEIIRQSYLKQTLSVSTVWIEININISIMILVGFSILSLILVNQIIRYKYD
uniref:ABC transmembrane type-2 domain-containing protein n=1 Tax=Osmundaria fimbriata TaxID=228265 RepID=A0A1Z1M4C5_OSMFI|nr:hypothetical protein [Osmundaria fimbriata]ARW60899.1 hypothetical protein [Osmundaria fimbriata]